MALAIVFALLAATGWGVSAIFARAGLQHMRSNTGTVISLASGVLMIGALALLIYGGDILAFPAVALLIFQFIIKGGITICYWRIQQKLFCIIPVLFYLASKSYRYIR